MYFLDHCSRKDDLERSISLRQLYQRSKRHLPVVALLCLGIFVSVFCFVFLRSVEERSARAAFQRAAQQRFDDVQSDLDVTVAKVVALGAFCEASPSVTRTSFEAFVTPLLSNRESGIQALEWAPEIIRDKRAAFEAAVQRAVCLNSRFVSA